MQLYERHPSLTSAMVSLVKYEYGFGGKPTYISPQFLEVQTPTWGWQDRTTWEGTEEEMAILVQVRRYVAATFSHNIHDHLTEALAPQLIKLTDGNPLLVTSLAGLMMGNQRLHIACLLLCDGPVLTEAAMQQALVMDTEDFISAVLLALEKKQNFLATLEQLNMKVE